MLIAAFAALALDAAAVPAGACKDPFGRIVTCLKADPHTLDANPEVPTTANTRKGTAGRCYWTNKTADHVPGQFTRCPRG